MEGEPRRELRLLLGNGRCSACSWEMESEPRRELRLLLGSGGCSACSWGMEGEPRRELRLLLVVPLLLLSGSQVMGGSWLGACLSGIIGVSLMLWVKGGGLCLDSFETSLACKQTVLAGALVMLCLQAPWKEEGDRRWHRCRWHKCRQTGFQAS